MASQEDKYSFKINSGPNKRDLMVSLFEGNSNRPITASFKLEGLVSPIRVAITSVQKEDGSGESWNIEGWVTEGPRAHVSGYYSSRFRNGNLRFKVPTTSAEEKELSEALERNKKMV